MIELTTENTSIPYCYKLPNKVKHLFVSCKSFDDLYFTLNHNDTTLYSGKPNFLCNDFVFSKYEDNNPENKIITSSIHTLYDHTIDALLPETDNYLIVYDNNIYNIWASVFTEKYPKRKDIAYRQYNIRNQGSITRLPSKVFLKIDNLHSIILLYDEYQNTTTLNTDVLYYYNQYTKNSKVNWYIITNYSFIKSDNFELIEEYYMKIK